MRRYSNLAWGAAVLGAVILLARSRMSNSQRDGIVDPWAGEKTADPELDQPTPSNPPPVIRTAAEQARLNRRRAM